MKLSGFMTLTFIAASCSLLGGQIIKDEKIDQFSWVKVHFDGHTYIQCVSKWNYSSNRILHDPGCSCRAERKKLMIDASKLPTTKKEKTND